MLVGIATGEIEDTFFASQNRRKNGVSGASARARSLTGQERVEIAKRAARALV